MVDFINSANTELQEGKSLEKITITPGLDANGNPTANSAQSINIANISANDNYGFAIDYEINLDGEE